MVIAAILLCRFRHRILSKTRMCKMNNIQRSLGNLLGRLLPTTTKHALVSYVGDKEPHLMLEVLGPKLNRKPNLDNMAFDLDVKSGLRFEHLAGLFASTSLDHAVIA